MQIGTHELMIFELKGMIKALIENEDDVSYSAIESLEIKINQIADEIMQKINAQIPQKNEVRKIEPIRNF